MQLLMDYYLVINNIMHKCKSVSVENLCSCWHGRDIEHQKIQREEGKLYSAFWVGLTHYVSLRSSYPFYQIRLHCYD